MKYTWLIALIGFGMFSGVASAELNCKNIDGKWSGKMRGVIGGATTMSIKNCRVTWKLPDGRFNRCRFKDKSGKTEYSCSLGSRGSVVIKGNRITMQNIYTASQHGAYKVNVSRVSQ